MAEKAGNGNGDGDGDGYISTQLFGGAMEADIPVGFEDVRYVLFVFVFVLFWCCDVM